MLVIVVIVVCNGMSAEAIVSVEIPSGWCVYRSSAF